MQKNPESSYVASLQNDFKKDQSSLLITLSIFIVLICVGLVLALIYLPSTHPKVKCFASVLEEPHEELILDSTELKALIEEETGKTIRMTPIIPLNMPNLNAEILLQWTANAVSSCYTMNFVDYEKKLEELKSLFTMPGYQSFQAALAEAGIIEQILDKKLVSSALPTGTPVIVQEGIAGGIYQWRLELPLTVTYQSGNTRTNVNLIIQVLVQRVSSIESPIGIGISQFIVSSGG